MKFNREFLKDCRKYNDYTQEELAELIGVTKQAVQKWEQGEVTPRMSKIKVMAEVLNTDIDNLVAMDATGNNIARQKGNSNTNATAIGNRNIFFNDTNASAIIADCRNRLITALIESDIEPVALKQVLQIVNNVLGGRK